MLEYIWFAVLLLLAIAFAFKVRRLSHEREAKEAAVWQVASYSAALIAIYVSWDRTGGVLLSSLHNVLPQTGTPIAELTAIMLTGIAVIIVVFGIPFMIFMIPVKTGKLKAISILERIPKILGLTGGGVYKRIDENRELLELLQREDPEFLKKHFEVIGWIKANDEFFTELADLIDLKEGHFLSQEQQQLWRFPRPWPTIQQPESHRIEGSLDQPNP